MAANLRALAARCTFAVVDKGRSLADELPQQIAKIDLKDKGLTARALLRCIKALTRA